MYWLTQKMHLVKIICCFLIIQYCLPLQIVACHLQRKHKIQIQNIAATYILSENYQGLGYNNLY